MEEGEGGAGTPRDLVSLTYRPPDRWSESDRTRGGLTRPPITLPVIVQGRYPFNTLQIIVRLANQILPSQF